LVRGEDGSVRNANLSAASSPFEVAEAIALEAKGRQRVTYQFDGLAD
jgi:hypothetical protein